MSSFPRYSAYRFVIIVFHFLIRNLTRLAIKNEGIVKFFGFLHVNGIEFVDMSFDNMAGTVGDKI